MSEKLNKVIANLPQSFSTAEQLQARTNIDAQKSISYGYSGSTITAIDGSAIAQSGALTFMTHDLNLTGSGTPSSPLGLSSWFTLSSGPYSGEYGPYSVDYRNADGFGQYGYNTMWLSSTAGTETHISDGSIEVKDNGDISMSLNPTGIFIDEHNGGDADLTIGHSSIVFSERYQSSQVVDRSSIERWNSYSAGLFSGLDHDYNLSGIGVSSSLLGLADPIKFSASGNEPDSLVSAIKVGNKGISAEVPSSWTAEFTYNRSKLSYEWPSAQDTENHEGLTSHTLITPANVHLSSHDCSYITHNVVDLDVDNGLRMYQGYSSGSLQSGIFACVSGYSNGPTIQFQQGTANEYVDIPSIRRWNGYSAGVSAGNGLTGNGTSGSPLGLANPSIISSNAHSSYRGDGFVMISASGGNRSYLNETVLEFQSAGTSFSVTPASIDLWNSYSAGRGWAESSNSLSTGYGGNQCTAGSQYADGAGNWVARTVKASGLPDSTLYGFGSKASNANGSLVGSNGQWLAYQPSYSAIYLTGSTTTYDSSYLPTGVTWPMRVDVWNLGDGADKNIKTDTFHGATSDLAYGDSATIWYVPSLDRWTDMVNV